LRGAGLRVAEYRLTIKPSAAKELERLAEPVASRVEAKIAGLANDPRPAGVKKLKGDLALWRIRIGDYRVIYSIDDRTDIVDVVRVRHRSKGYD